MGSADEERESQPHLLLFVRESLILQSFVMNFATVVFPSSLL